MFDLGSLPVLRSELRSFLSDFDASKLSGACLGLAIDDMVAISFMMSHLVGLLTARQAELKEWETAGKKSAAHYAANVLGTSVAEAERRLQTTQSLTGLAATSAAAASGALSPQQAEIVADAASANPTAEAELLEAARTGSLGALHEAARVAKAQVRDMEEARRQAHARRSLRSFTDRDGAFRLIFSHTPEVGAEITASVDALADAFFREARAEGRHESPVAYRADALVELIRGCAGGGDTSPRDKTEKSTDSGRRNQIHRPEMSRALRNAKVIVRVDHDVLVRGTIEPGDICEVSGIGPVAASVVRETLAHGNPFVAAIHTQGKDVLRVAHLGRGATAVQRTALDWMYPTCAALGCVSSSHLEIDHRIEWSKSRVTRLDQLDRLCTHHHDLKSREGWALVPGKGKRPFVAPDDRRHPRHRDLHAVELRDEWPRAG